MTNPPARPADEVRWAARRLAAVGSEMEVQGQDLAHAAGEVNVYWTGDDGSVAVANEIAAIAAAVRARHKAIRRAAAALLAYANELDAGSANPENVRHAATTAIRAVTALSPNAGIYSRGQSRHGHVYAAWDRDARRPGDGLRHGALGGEAPLQGAPTGSGDTASTRPRPPWVWGGGPPRQGLGLWHVRWVWGADPPRQGEGLRHMPPRPNPPPIPGPPKLPAPLRHAVASAGIQDRG